MLAEGIETKNDLLVAKISDSSSSNPNADLIKSYLLNRIHQDYDKDIVESKENQLRYDIINHK